MPAADVRLRRRRAAGMRRGGAASNLLGSDEAGNFVRPITTSQGPNTTRPNKTMKSSLGLSVCASNLHPQSVHMSESESEVAGLSRRLAGSSPAAPVSPIEDDDLLREILLRLPPQPSSLPRASAVCKRWLGLVTDPKFTRRFRVHHRKLPLLGFFEHIDEEIVFTPVLDRPDRVPPERFDIGRGLGRYYCDLLDCRHGLVLVRDCMREEVVVCDPITGEQCRLAVPPEFWRGVLCGAVLCAAGNQGHVHGGCHSRPFKVVLVSTGDSRALAYVYSSEAGVWGNLISTAAPYKLLDVSATLVGNALYWLLGGDQNLVFDLDGQSLALITGPPVTNDILYGNRRIIQGEDGDVVFAILSCSGLQTWQRKVNCHGVATWVPWKTIEMHTVLGLHSPVEKMYGRLLGYDEDNGVIFLYVKAGVYMVQLVSMLPRKVYETFSVVDRHPFTSFFTPGMAIAGSRHIG